MRIFLIVLITGLLTASCFTAMSVSDDSSESSIDHTDQILPDKTINHTYQNIEFLPEANKLELQDGIFLTVKPINATILNRLTLDAAYRSGNYEHEVISEYSVSEEQDLTRSERRYLENSKNISEEIIDAINSGDITVELGQELSERIWSESGSRNGSELEMITGRKSIPDFNPYFMGRNYLSVFNLSFENKTNQVENVAFVDFQIASGNEVLYPFRMEYFETRFTGDNARLDNAYRYNLPDNLNIAPNQIIEKYIGIPAIDKQTEHVSLQYIDTEGRESFYNFKLLQQNENLEITFKNYFIIPDSYRLRPSREYFYAVQLENGTAFSLESDNFFVPEETTSQSIMICGECKSNSV